MSKADERTFQDEIIADLVKNGWLLGEPQNYNRELALYSEDVLAFVKESQPEEWRKYEKYYKGKADERFLQIVAEWLGKSNPNDSDRELRRYGTLGVLRQGVKDTPCRFSLCQSKPEHDLNPDTLKRYKQNRLRVVPELVYSPYAKEEHLKQNGSKAKAYRIDLVLFLNGIPIATLELKSEFKQAVQNAIKQYKQTRLPKDPVAKKAEPLLSFKRGALVHFAVSQYEVYMCTRLNGNDSYFLPFNRGTADGGAGNDVPADAEKYATDYLWNEVLLPENLLAIIHNFIHLEIEEKEDAKGLKYKKETLIFPRYHQWDVVKKLLNAVDTEGPGQRYLIQHSAGSGKSNSIAWTAHQLATRYDKDGNKVFNSVIVVTDRTVLDDQLQDTISQFAVHDSMVGRINRKEGQGSKSEKLAKALNEDQDIIIVTIQTFGFVLDWIEKSEALRNKNYAVIADEAHSSQGGRTAKQMKEMLKAEENAEDTEVDDEEQINIYSERTVANMSYFAFTATPKDRTLQLFGRSPDPSQPPSKKNLPEAFHVYTMRQAIEEGFILDVLKNYTTYKAAYQLALKSLESDKEVDRNKAKTKLNQWVTLHAHNISQKVKIIVEHFRENVKDCLHGQAKAMVVTSSRKSAVRYKLAMDKYVRDQKYTDVVTMVAFSGEVNDEGETYNESNMNPGLKGRDMRKAFDTPEYQIMLVANKFQTGFDQPKLCAMYVDKKLAGVECVQTLSRLNRCYPGKKESGTFVLDFYNKPEEILAAFQPYYNTAELADVSDPNHVYEIFEKLNSQDIYQWTEVEQFYSAFMNQKISAAAISNICRPSVERWQYRYKEAYEKHKHARDIFERTKKSGDAILIANAENEMNEHKKVLDKLVMFKKDLGSFTRFYEFMSQIVVYDDITLDQLSLFARHLRPLLREEVDQDEIDLSSVVLTHYRLSKIREQNITLGESTEDDKLKPTSDLGSGKARNPEEEFLSSIIDQLNDIFGEDGLTAEDKINYANTLLDKVRENDRIMEQFKNNTREQALLGDFPSAFLDAVIQSGDIHEKLKVQLLSDNKASDSMMRLIYDMWQHNETQQQHAI